MSSETLPSNATALEITLVDAGVSVIDALAPRYGVYFDPAECPEDALPFLAHTLGLPIWRESWSVEKKRWILAEWPVIAGKLGTEDAIRWAIHVAEAQTLAITTPPQMVFAGALPEDNAEAWESWLAGLPEIQLQAIRRIDDENGLCGEIGTPDETVTPGMFLGAEDGSATCFAAGPMIVEQAFIIREGVETQIAFSRRPDTRVGRVGEVIDFFWPGEAGFGLFADDAMSADYFAGGAPPAQTHASVKFGYGLGSETSWNLIGNSPYIQDVNPRMGELQDDDKIGIFANESWVDRFLDELDPIRGTYQSFRIMDGHAQGQPVASFLDDARFGMPAYTAEILTKVPGNAGKFAAFANNCFADESYATDGLPPAELDLVCDAVSATKSHRDVTFVDLDIPALRLREIRSWAELTSLR